MESLSLLFEGNMPLRERSNCGAMQHEIIQLVTILLLYHLSVGRADGMRVFPPSPVLYCTVLYFTCTGPGMTVCPPSPG